MKIKIYILFLIIILFSILDGCLRKMEFNQINNAKAYFINNIYKDSNGNEWGVFISKGYYTILPHYWYLWPFYLKIEITKHYNEYQEFGPGKIYNLFLYKKVNGNWQKWVLLDGFKSELFKMDPSFTKIFEYNSYLYIIYKSGSGLNRSPIVY